MRLYHLSYDTINCERDFGTYANARRYLLCVLGSSTVRSMSSYTESSIILEFEVAEPTRFFNFLRNNLSQYFYYSISLVAQNQRNRHDFISHNPNMQLNLALQRELKALNCNNLGIQIIPY